MMFAQVVEMLQRYFAEHAIDTYGFTLVLNFQDFQSATKLDYALRKEFAQYSADAVEIDTADFKVNGIEVRLESPVHVRLMK